MKDRVQTESIETVDIGADGHLHEWADIDWRSVKKRVKNLRHRIYRATPAIAPNGFAPGLLEA